MQDLPTSSIYENPSNRLTLRLETDYAFCLVVQIVYATTLRCYGIESGELKLIVVTVFGHHLIGKNPWRDDG